MSDDSNDYRWTPLSEVVAILDSDWCWGMNPECKYIDVRIDMRDGKCLLRNRRGKLITLEELKRQRGRG